MVLTMRDVDLENSGRLKQMAGIRVLESPDEIAAAIGSLPAKKETHGQ